MRLLIRMTFLIESYQIWLYPKILDLTLNSVPDGYIAGIVYRIYNIYQAKCYFWVWLMVKLLMCTQFLIKRAQLAYIFKKHKIIIFGACHRAQKRFLDHNFKIIHFRACSWHKSSSSSSPSNFWLKEIQLGYFGQFLLQINMERAQDNGHGLDTIRPVPKSVPGIFTFSEVYGFHFKSQKSWSDGKLNCYKLIPVYIAMRNDLSNQCGKDPLWHFISRKNNQFDLKPDELINLIF